MREEGEIASDNSSAALWLALIKLAVLRNGANPDMIATVTGNVFLAQRPEAFACDADGNLTSDGRSEQSQKKKTAVLVLASVKRLSQSVDRVA